MALFLDDASAAGDDPLDDSATAAEKEVANLLAQFSNTDVQEEKDVRDGLIAAANAATRTPASPPPKNVRQGHFFRPISPAASDHSMHSVLSNDSELSRLMGDIEAANRGDFVQGYFADEVCIHSELLHLTNNLSVERMRIKLSYRCACRHLSASLECAFELTLLASVLVCPI